MPRPLTSTPSQRSSQALALGLTPPTLLWLIRHAEVEENYQNVFGGRLDIGLSANGRAQAEAMASYLRHRRLDAIYASPMRRVQQSLEPVLRNGAPHPVILPELREMDFGDWTGLHWDEVSARYGVSASSWLEALESGGMPNAESVPALRQRLEPCFRRIVAAHPGGQVAVFCHGGVIRMALAILMGWPLASLGGFELEYASLTQAACVPDRANLRLLNFTPWREIGV